jgi:hypothetical protein
VVAEVVETEMMVVAAVDLVVVEPSMVAEVLVHLVKVMQVVQEIEDLIYLVVAVVATVVVVLVLVQEVVLAVLVAHLQDTQLQAEVEVLLLYSTVVQWVQVAQVVVAQVVIVELEQLQELPIQVAVAVETAIVVNPAQEMAVLV